jgi:rubrerythrin
MPTQEKHGEWQMREETRTSGKCAMDTQFNVFEVLQIAEEVQTKAATFCLRAAERFADEERCGLWHRLAEWRTQHRETWRRIRHQYSERTGECGTFDPDNYVLSHPWTMAGLTGYGTDPRGYDQPSGRETGEQILLDAIRRSQGIVIFYHGLKDFARGRDSRLMIDNMIDAEEGHIRLLIRTLEQMQAPVEEGDDPQSVCAAGRQSR